MKRICILILSLATMFQAAAQSAEHLRERVYLSTDKSAYVAGDMMWVSAFCADVNTGKFSSFSKTAYIELHSDSGMVQTGKIALLEGRGAGRIILGNSLPTGNYRLLAYTAQSCNENGYDYAADARTISIFNTLSNERSGDGVKISENIPSTETEDPSGKISIEVPSQAASSSEAVLKVVNNGGEPVTFSLSVFHNDGISATEGGRIGRFSGNVKALGKTAASFNYNRTAEYEGEVIHARVAGIDSESMASLNGKYTFISAPGNKENMYSTVIREDGSASFFTSNIYGEKDLFSEIEELPEGMICHMEIKSPFVDADAGAVPELVMNRSYSDALSQRSMSMQIEKAFDADTLYSMLPLHDHKTFTGNTITYILDDYTRFPEMTEVITEYVSELRIRKTGKKNEIQVQVEDYAGLFNFSEGVSLMMIDGIPVLDHQKILDYDPLLVERIEISTDTYFMGVRSFGGVANFVTYKRNLPTMNFADNVRIISYQGVSFPLAYTCEEVSSDYPDYRQTIYWHPVLSIGPGESLELKCKTPAYGGRFDVSVEGLTDSLDAVSAGASFNVVRQQAR